MSNSKGIEELTKAIEHAVEAYLEAGRRAVQETLERALSPSRKTPASRNLSGRKKATTTTTKKKPRKNGPRRTPEELAELERRLYEAVQGEPGRSMVLIASQLGATVRELHHPMSVLKRAERVRSVGRKQHMRYFPAVIVEAEASAA